MTDRIGKTLRAARLALGLTQAEIGVEIGITRNSVARIERGEIGVSGSTRKMIELLAARAAET